MVWVDWKKLFGVVYGFKTKISNIGRKEKNS